jgi:hypothetical protein
LRLVAYLVAAGEMRPATTELRRWLKAQLPEYMVPAAFVWLDQLPLTPSGKLDRKALPPPAYAIHEHAYRAPRTPIEEIIAGIWGQLLGVERVGLDDNFFELGGHSLLATQVVSRVRDRLQVEVAVAILFQAPVLASFAQEVERAGQGNRTRNRLLASQSIVMQSRDTALPLSYAQERLWFL